MIRPNTVASAFGPTPTPAKTNRPRSGFHPAYNRAIAAKLAEYASLLEQQQASLFRIRAYERAAAVIGGLDRPVGEILTAEGQQGLIKLPGIGAAIAASVTELATTGHWSQLERLRGGLAPESLFQSLPGVGPRLARSLSEELQLQNLEDFESAATDGSLDRAKGWGRKRVAMVRAATAERLNRARPRGWSGEDHSPPVELLLDVDFEYRRKASAGVLRRIAPKRFNPTGEAWLPVLHAERGPWRFTALSSNTARAHELGRTGDWVVIYYQTHASSEGQCTLVTETAGPLAGSRVVRGREGECLRLLQANSGEVARSSVIVT